MRRNQFTDFANSATQSLTRRVNTPSFQQVIKVRLITHGSIEGRPEIVRINSNLTTMVIYRSEYSYQDTQDFLSLTFDKHVVLRYDALFRDDLLNLRR